MRLFPLLPRSVLAIAALLFLMAVAVTGCSDDPILGPDDGKPDDGGGSYSVIKRLAPPDTAATADTARAALSPSSSPTNPERF